MAGPENEPLNPDESEEWEEEPPRSIFARTWFRVVIVVLAVGAVASIAIPYLMDSGHVSGPSMSRVAAPPAPAGPLPAAPPVPATPPAAETPSASAPIASAVKPAEPPKAPKPVQPEAPKQVAQAKPEPPKAEPAEKAAPPKTAAKARTKSAPAATKSDATDALWVQVGAFRDPATAKKVADGLKAQGFEVAESTLTRGGGSPAAAVDGTPSGPADKYDVVVVGSAADITKKLSDKGLSAETVRDGAVVRPSLPLRDAVTLSNDLRGEGFAVTVRRVTTGGAAPTPAPVASGGDTLHLVRVGAFADRTAANAAIEKLRALGYTPFVARGRE